MPEAPEVGAFWSVTVYDTERGGHLHPNAENRYHLNNTTATSTDGGKTYTFLFKTSREEGDVNCLEVPEGQFDLTVRYYLPGTSITEDGWRINKPKLVKPAG